MLTDYIIHYKMKSYNEKYTYIKKKKKSTKKLNSSSLGSQHVMVVSSVASYPLCYLS